MDLGKNVVDSELLDRNGRRGGKVDDLLLELAEPDEGRHLAEPEVVGIISGPMAAASLWPRWAQRVVRQVYRLLGVADPHPVCIPWSAVSAIEVVVHADVDRDEVGLTVLADAVRRRVIGRLPGS